MQTGVLHHRHHFGVLKQTDQPVRRARRSEERRAAADQHRAAGRVRRGRQEGAGLLLPHVPDRPSRRTASRSRSPTATTRSSTSCSLRVFDAGWRETFEKFDPIPNRKTDTNNHGPFSTDNIGMNYDYPEASYERRREILKEHETYQKGWLYFIANDPRVPEGRAGARCAKWGLPKDEFTDNGDWPHQIYVREARRMIGEYVMTENELLKKRPTPDSVGMGSLHASTRTTSSATSRPRATCRTRRHRRPHRRARTRSPTARSCRSAARPTNLLVPVCVSSSHIAFGSIRMEPVFMILASRPRPRPRWRSTEPRRAGRALRQAARAPAHGRPGARVHGTEK